MPRSTWSCPTEPSISAPTRTRCYGRLSGCSSQAVGCRSLTSSCTGTSRPRDGTTSRFGLPELAALSWRESTSRRSSRPVSSTSRQRGGGRRSLPPAGSERLTRSKPKASTCWPGSPSSTEPRRRRPAGQLWRQLRACPTPSRSPLTFHRLEGLCCVTQRSGCSDGVDHRQGPERLPSLQQWAGVARGADRGSGTLHAASERRLVHDLRGGAAVARQAAGTGGFDFSNAGVVVTGAGAGIGQGIAQAFHAAGGRVALGDLRKDAVERAAAGLGGEGTFAGVVDVRDEKSVQAFFAAAERALGPVTIAVANAGIYPNCPVLDMTVEEWDRVMETNMRGVFLTCQAAARSMKAGARAGKIITISSGAYASGRVGASHYCASKAGVVMFTRVLAMELAEQRINVNCIAPGYIKVDSGTSPPSSDFETALIKNTPWGRLGTPADIAPAALFLASPAADYVTGEVLAVNGGAFAGRMYLPLSTPKAR